MIRNEHYAAEGPATAPWPIVSRNQASLSYSERQRILQIASSLLDAEPAIAGTAFAGTRVNCGWRPAPTLYLEDHRSIELTSEQTARHFEYRSLGLASDQDFYLISREHDPTYERYVSDTLGFGAPGILRVQPDSRTRKSLCSACCDDPDAMRRLIGAARDAGTINIMPFISNGHVWELGRKIAVAADVDVQIAAPPPRLSQYCNDKLWFSDQAQRVLGRDSLLTTWRAYSPAAAAALIRSLAASNERLVVKIPSSAGAMGNLIFSSENVRDLPLRVIRGQILRRLNTIGWRGHFPVQVAVWEENTLASPSAQVWIPSAAMGDPVIESIYTQMFSDEAGRFSGATDAEMPEDVSQKMADEAMQLAYLFQSLGYFGRISFDALLCGDSPYSSALHWIECNARWGGVSIPMTIANRLGAQYPDSRTVIVQMHAADRCESFADHLATCAPLQYSHCKQEGLIWLNSVLPSIILDDDMHGIDVGVVNLPAHSGINFMCISHTLDEAIILSKQTMELLQRLN